MSQETYQECLEIIRKWNTDGVYIVDGESEGKIQLCRQKPSMCEICTWKTEPHMAMDGFCQIYDGKLYYHCGRCKGRGKILSSLSTVRSAASDRLAEYAAMLSAHRHVEYTVVPKGRAEESRVIDAEPPKPPRMYLRPCDGNTSREALNDGDGSGVISALLSSDLLMIPAPGRETDYPSLPDEVVLVKDVPVIRQLPLPVALQLDTRVAKVEECAMKVVVPTKLPASNVIRVVRPPRVKREPEVSEEKATFAQSIRGATRTPATDRRKARIAF